MATKKISELEAINAAEDNDVLVIVDTSESTTNKITKGNLLIGAGHTIEMTLNENYQIVLVLKNAAGTALSTQTIDLPNENAVTNLAYNNGVLTITKQSGATSQINLTGLIEGLVTENDFNTFKEALQTTLEAINEKDAEQDEAISENYKVINKLNEKLENQQKVIDQLPQVTGQGTSITLENTIEAQFTKFDVEGNSVQDGSPSPDNEVPILSAGDNGSINEKINNKNLINFDKLAWYPIKDDGTIDTSKQGTHTDYIKIAKNEDYIFRNIKFVNGVYYYISYYDSKKVHLRNETAKWVTNLTEINSSDATYIIISWLYISPNEIKEKLNPQLQPGTTATPYVPHEEQDYSIFVQQPMRSIGDVRDCFVKKSDGKLYERHYIKYLELLISAMNNSENYPGWTNVQQIKNDFPNINTQLITKTSFLCNIFEKTSRIMVINTVGNNSILYLDKSLLNLTQTQWKENYPDLILKLAYISPLPIDLPCTEEQIEQLENKPSTYKDFTIIQSQDETPAHLEVSGIRDIDTMFDKVTNAIVSLGGNV